MSHTKKTRRGQNQNLGNLPRKDHVLAEAEQTKLKHLGEMSKTKYAKNRRHPEQQE